jgi:hypothetical protein
MRRSQIISSFTFLIILTLVVSGCNMPRGNKPTPTPNVTQAYQTVEARLTQAATLNPPTAAPTDSGIQTQTPTQQAITPTLTLAPSPTSPKPTNTCDIAGAGTPIDVTVPDDTQMQPGQAFTKIWRLQNVGTCTWSKDYSIALFSGANLSAPASVSVPSEVTPGLTVDIAVDMEAPQEAGVYQGNWKLRNASGVWFGIGPSGGSPFWVKIVVVGSGTPGTTTPTATATSGPPIQANGTILLTPSDRLNLDNNRINSGSGDDLVYDKDSDNKLFLTPLSVALFGVWGTSQPSLADCQSAAISSVTIPLESLHQGVYLCYRTDLGLIGWLLLSNFNNQGSKLTVQFLTWAAP